MASRAVDLLIAYRVIKLLVTPFKNSPAFRAGIIDDKGKVLKPYRLLKTSKEKSSYTMLHRFVFNMKRILGKVGLGSKLGSFAVALALLIKEDKSFAMYKDAIESGVIMYLKEQGEYDKLLKEEGEIPELNIEQEPFMTCFGVDVYERGDELVSETEYAQAL